MNRVIGYIRVSTVEQAESGAGLDAQREAIRLAVDVQDLELVDVIVDAGFSAGDMDRPGLQEALRRLRCHEADSLIVAKLDRLSRSVMDFATLSDRAWKQKWGIILLDFGLDTSTPTGEMLATVLASFAQFERQMIALRTKEGMAAKKAAGVRFGRPKSLSDELRARLRADRDSGMSYATIAQTLNDEHVPTARGGEQWWAGTVYAALKAA